MADLREAAEAMVERGLEEDGAVHPPRRDVSDRRLGASPSVSTSEGTTTEAGERHDKRLCRMVLNCECWCDDCKGNEHDPATREVVDEPTESLDALTFARFAEVNRARCEAPDGFRHHINGWTLSDWFTAAVGEFGEAANKAKKLNRYRDGIPGNTETADELRAGLADEIADTAIYLDLLAQAAGIDLGAAIVSKFNRTSQKIGAPHRLSQALRSEQDKPDDWQPRPGEKVVWSE